MRKTACAPFLKQDQPEKSSRVHAGCHCRKHRQAVKEATAEIAEHGTRRDCELAKVESGYRKDGSSRSSEGTVQPTEMFLNAHRQGADGFNVPRRGWRCEVSSAGERLTSPSGVLFELRLETSTVEGRLDLRRLRAEAWRARVSRLRAGETSVHLSSSAFSFSDSLIWSTMGEGQTQSRVRVGVVW